jgi:6-phospho-3-hexuloisomerase
MEPLKRLAQELLDEITGMLSTADNGVYTSFVNNLLTANHVVVAGDGRARWVLGTFVRRMSRLGRSVTLHGESVSRAAGKGDLLIVASLKGARGPLTVLAESARKRGARVYAFVGETSSVLASTADGIIPLAPQTRTPFDSISGGGRASLLAFDEALMIYLDSVVLSTQDILRVATDETEAED